MDITDYIFEQEHPYYLQGICSADSYYHEYCQENKYRILRKWSGLNVTTEELKFRLPRASFADIVELCLLYYPIPESSKYYDGITLFRYACERRLDNALDFVTNWVEFLFSDLIKEHGDDVYVPIGDLIYIICLICYKYKFIKPLVDISQSQKSYFSDYRKQSANIMILCIRAITDPKIKSNITISSHMVNFMLKMDIFTPEEIGEFIIICSSVFVTENEINDLLLGLQGKPIPEQNWDISAGLLINNKSNINILQQYVNKYGLSIDMKKVEKVPERMHSISVFYGPRPKINYSLISDFDFYNLRATLLPYLKESDRMACYATNGDFISYVDLRSRGYKLEKRKESQMLDISLINNLGFHSLNRDILRLLDYDSNNIINQWRFIDNNFMPGYYPSKEDKIRRQIADMKLPGSVGSKLQLIEMMLAGNKLWRVFL